MGGELFGVDVDADHAQVVVFFRAAHEGRVAIVQASHRRNKADGLTLPARRVQHAAQLNDRPNDAHGSMPRQCEERSPSKGPSQNPVGTYADAGWSDPENPEQDRRKAKYQYRSRADHPPHGGRVRVLLQCPWFWNAAAGQIIRYGLPARRSGIYPARDLRRVRSR